MREAHGTVHLNTRDQFPIYSVDVHIEVVNARTSFRDTIPIRRDGLGYYLIAVPSTFRVPNVRRYQTLDELFNDVVQSRNLEVKSLRGKVQLFCDGNKVPFHSLTFKTRKAVGWSGLGEKVQLFWEIKSFGTKTSSGTNSFDKLVAEAIDY